MRFIAFYLINLGNDKKSEVTFATVKSYIRDSYIESKVAIAIYYLYENGELFCKKHKIEFKKDKNSICKILDNGITVDRGRH